MEGVDAACGTGVPRLAHCKPQHAACRARGCSRTVPAGHAPLPQTHSVHAVCVWTCHHRSWSQPTALHAAHTRLPGGECRNVAGQPRKSWQPARTWRHLGLTAAGQACSLWARTFTGQKGSCDPAACRWREQAWVRRGVTRHDKSRRQRPPRRRLLDAAHPAIRPRRRKAVQSVHSPVLLTKAGKELVQRAGGARQGSRIACALPCTRSEYNEISGKSFKGKGMHPASILSSLREIGALPPGPHVGRVCTTVEAGIPHARDHDLKSIGGTALLRRRFCCCGGALFIPRCCCSTLTRQQVSYRRDRYAVKVPIVPPDLDAGLTVPLSALRCRCCR